MRLSLDFAFANVGWAIYSDQDLLIKSGCFENEKVTRKGQADLIYRCGLFFEFANSILSLYPIQIIIGELPFGARSAKSATTMGCCWAMWAYLIKLTPDCGHWLVTPGQMKKFINYLSSAKDPKDRAREACLELEGLTVKNEHEADAICIYHTWLNMKK